MEVIAHQVLRIEDGDPLGALRALVQREGFADRFELDAFLLEGRLVAAHDERELRRAQPVALADVLDVLDEAGAKLLLDPKSDQAAVATGELVVARGLASRVMFCGEPQAVDAAWEVAREAGRAWTLPTEHGSVPSAWAGPFGSATSGAKRRVQAAAAAALAAQRTEAFCVERRFVTEELVEEVHRLGGRVIGWTVNREREVHQLAAMGVDGLITDDPDLVRRALG